MDLPDLRPLTFGELLDQTFTYFRRHFWLFVAIMAIPQVAIFTVSMAWQGLERTSWLNAGGASRAMVAGSALLGTIILLLAYFVLYAIALGATTFAVSEIHLGHTTTARSAYRRMKGRYWSLIDLIATVVIRACLLLLVAPVVFVAEAALAGGLGGFGSRLVAGIIVLLTVAGVLGGIFFVVWFILRYGCAVPALLLENLKATPALKRSVALTKKNLGRVFLVVVLMSLVSWVVAMVLEGPFLVAGMWMAVKTHGQPPFLLTLGMNIAGGVGHAVTGPLLMIGLVLLYYDIRVRKEGFDLQVMMTTLDTQAPVPGVSMVPPGPAAPQLEKTSVVLILVLNLLTSGLYYPLWFIRRRSAINALRSREKLGLGVFLLVLFLWLLVLVLNIGNTYFRLPIVNGSMIAIRDFSSLVALVYGVLLVIQTFKVRRILEDHAAASVEGPFANSIALAQEASLSAVATFFFGIFYLQHKINQMAGTWTEGQPGMGTGVIPVT